MLNIQTPDQVQAAIDAEKKLRYERANFQPTPVIDHLAAHVKNCWAVAQQDRNNITERLLDCLRRRRGEYDSAKLAAIRTMGGSEIYMKITSAKCAAAKSWLADIFTPAGDRPWSLTPSPVAELPPHFKQQLITEAVNGALQLGVPIEDMQELVAQHEVRLRDEIQKEAESRAERMSDQIEDVLVQGDYRQQFDAFLDDLTTYPSAIFKGPIYRRTKKLRWVQAETGEFVADSQFSVTRQFRRVSPFDFFPSPATVNPNDSWVIERHRLTPSDLSAMRGAAGYNSQGIALALSEYRLNGNKQWTSGDSERDRLEGRQVTNVESEFIEALEWSGKIQGKMLTDWGMNPAGIPDPYEEYQCSVMVVGNHVIRALVNPDPTDQNDYFSASWRPVPNSFWGESLTETLKDCQDICNNAARSLANNMSIASGPMLYYTADRMSQGQDVSKLHPWKIFGVTESRTGSSAKPIDFFQPASHAQELLAIYERFSRYADDICGIPAYATGSDQGAGAAKTASGLAMLMNSASRGIKQVVRTIDIRVIEPLIRKTYNHLMLDPTIPADCKGDLSVKALGSESLLHKEANQALTQQFLLQTGNPVDMQILGLEGRRELLKESAKGLDIPVDRIIPSEEEMLQRQMQMMMQGQAPAGPADNSGTGPDSPPQDQLPNAR